MSQVMIHHQEAAIGEAGAELQMEIGAGKGADDGHGVDLFGLGVRQVETGGDGPLGHFGAIAPGPAAAHQLGFLDGGEQFAILENGRSGVA